MIRSVLIGLLTVAIAATGYWGYTEHQEKNAILIKAENNYQRAFHQLTYHIDQLNDEIGSALAMNSKKSLSPSLAEVWRIASNARSDVGQLPLSLMPFNKTEEFLSKIGDFSYRVAVRDLDKEPLTKEEVDTLRQLHKKSGEIKKELRRVQSLALKNNLRWMDVELALASEDEPMDNTIVDGFKTVEKNIEDESEVKWGSTEEIQIRDKTNLNKYLSGKPISANKAKEIALKFIGSKKSPANVKVDETNKNSNYAVYNVTIDRSNDETIYMDISKKGGHPIWMLSSRDIKENKIGLNEATKRAEKFLKEKGFKNMTLADSNQFDQVGILTFVRFKDGIVYYPDSVTVKVALDDGSIVGYEGINYLTSHKKRTLPNKTISVEKAKKQVNPNVSIHEEQLALIENEGKEVLCYEFIGTIDDDTYRMYINATNGEEEKVEKLKDPEPLYS